MVDRLVDLEPARRETADARPGPPRLAVAPHQPPLFGPTRSALLTAPGLSAGGSARRPTVISSYPHPKDRESVPPIKPVIHTAPKQGRPFSPRITKRPTINP